MVTPNLFQPVLTPKVGVVQLWKVIESFEFLDSIQEDHTFNFTPITFADNSMLVLEVDGTSNQNINIRTRINGISSNDYFQDGSVITTFPTAETIIDLNSNDGFIISNIITGGRTGYAILYYQLNKGGSNTFVGVEINANRTTNLGGGRSYRTTGKLNQNITSISSIEVSTGVVGRFWLIGTRMTLYKVSR